MNWEETPLAVEIREPGRKVDGVFVGIDARGAGLVRSTRTGGLYHTDKPLVSTSTIARVLKLPRREVTAAFRRQGIAPRIRGRNPRYDLFEIARAEVQGRFL